MKTFPSIALLGIVFCGGQGFTGSLSAQTVQLPSLHTFHYSGSVLVPDGGTTALGGVSRSASSVSRHPLGLSRGMAASHSGLSVSAQIIDLGEMDRQIRGVGKGDSTGHGVPIGLNHRMRRVERGKSMIRRARRLYRQDRQSQAFQEYLNAIRLLHGRLQRFAVVEFRRLFGTAADQALLPYQL